MGKAARGKGKGSSITFLSPAALHRKIMDMKLETRYWKSLAGPVEVRQLTPEELAERKEKAAARVKQSLPEPKFCWGCRTQLQRKPGKNWYCPVCD